MTGQATDQVQEVEVPEHRVEGAYELTHLYTSLLTETPDILSRGLGVFPMLICYILTGVEKHLDDAIKIYESKSQTQKTDYDQMNVFFATTLALMDDPSEAVRYEGKIKDRELKDQVLLYIVRSQLRLGQVEGARSLARLIGNDKIGRKALNFILEHVETT